MRVGFDRFTFDSETRELRDERGRRLHLSPKAFDVLRLLLEERPRVVSKTELHDRVWAGTFVGDATLSVVIAEIRRALGDSRAGTLIRTVHRVGYAFSGQATDRPAGAAPARSSRTWLNWKDTVFQLFEGEHVIGRDPRCNVWIDASGVSRRHAKLVVSGERATLEDLGSSNGTFIRGTRLTAPRPLVHGDVIEIGSTSVTFRVWSDERPPETERLRR